MKWQKKYWYYLIFAICFAGFQIIEDKIRVKYLGDNQLLIYLMGVAPNFLPGIGLAAALYVFMAEGVFPVEKVTGHQTNYAKSAFLISTIGLIAWEFVQIIAPRGTFDWNDVLFTLLGGVCFLILYKIIGPVR
jgi:glycopeptide antibiotics resistance protein